jgi:hypothetical protein
MQVNNQKMVLGNTRTSLNAHGNFNPPGVTFPKDARVHKKDFIIAFSTKAVAV